jgi:hypothetical protein
MKPLATPEQFNNFAETFFALLEIQTISLARDYWDLWREEYAFTTWETETIEDILGSYEQSVASQIHHAERILSK